MAGGSYLVTRKIRMLVETWDRTPLAEQEEIVGRAKGSGAPLGRSEEFDPVDFGPRGPDGGPAVAQRAHVRLAHPSGNGGAHLLRRGYNFVDGSDGLGRLDAGLFFIAYQRDPRRQFVPIQTQLARHDADERISAAGVQWLVRLSARGARRRGLLGTRSLCLGLRGLAVLSRR